MAINKTSNMSSNCAAAIKCHRFVSRKYFALMIGAIPADLLSSGGNETEKLDVTSDIDDLVGCENF
jgi:hypothetical protein